MEKLFLNQRNQLRSGVVILFAFAIFSLATMVRELLNFFFERLAFPLILAMLVSVALQITVMFLLSRFLIRQKLWGISRPKIDAFSLRGKQIPKLIFGALLGVAAFLLAIVPLYLSGQFSIEVNSAAPTAILYNLLVSFVYYIGVAYCEELMSRGLMLHAFLRFGPWKALGLSSLIFSLLHFPSANFNFLALFNIALIGACLGLSLYVSHSIWFPIGFHLTWNWVQGPLLGIPVSGGDSPTSALFLSKAESANAILTGGTFGAEASLFCSIACLMVLALLFLYGKKKKRFTVYSLRLVSTGHHCAKTK